MTSPRGHNVGPGVFQHPFYSHHNTKKPNNVFTTLSALFLCSLTVLFRNVLLRVIIYIATLSYFLYRWVWPVSVVDDEDSAVSLRLPGDSYPFFISGYLWFSLQSSSSLPYSDLHSWFAIWDNRAVVGSTPYLVGYTWRVQVVDSKSGVQSWLQTRQVNVFLGAISVIWPRNDKDMSLQRFLRFLVP